MRHSDGLHSLPRLVLLALLAGGWTGVLADSLVEQVIYRFCPQAAAASTEPSPTPA